MSQKNKIRVVAALFQKLNAETRQKEILIFQRGKHVSGAGFWEFPGGKVEATETDEDSLIREMKEELNIQIKVLNLVGEHVHQYGDRVIHIFLYEVSTEDELHFDLIDHQDYAWVTQNKIKEYQISGADVALLQKISW